MQRIDENTYIDDTLVTCAEYQLFIDEMREQGKYYQPDHWNSYQFPAGQAHEPILGVRQLDAIAFCEWLMQREIEEWKFRLPFKKEADAFAANSLGSDPHGYWINGHYQFAWVGSISKNVRSINHSAKLSIPRNFSGNLVQNIFQQEIPRDFDHVIDQAIDKAIDRAHALDIDLDLKIVKANENDFSESINYDAPHELAIAIERYYIHSRNINHNYTSDYVNQLNLILKLVCDLAFTPNYSIGDGKWVFNCNDDRMIDVYIDIFTLQERIAGRSPAFEGIRLVKERIR